MLHVIYPSVRSTYIYRSPIYLPWIKLWLSFWKECELYFLYASMAHGCVVLYSGWWVWEMRCGRVGVYLLSSKIVSSTLLPLRFGISIFFLEKHCLLDVLYILEDKKNTVYNKPWKPKPLGTIVWMC